MCVSFYSLPDVFLSKIYLDVIEKLMYLRRSWFKELALVFKTFLPIFAKINPVVSRKIASPRGAHPNSRTCEFVTLHGKLDFQMFLRMGSPQGSPQSSHKDRR
jgi:hypothetical protein